MSVAGADRGTILFLADLHLDASCPETLETALGAFEAAAAADALWILGDLFEAWIGDDAGLYTPLAQRVATSLRGLAEGGTTVHLMHGNRDFLLGDDFARRAGATLHQEDEITLEFGDSSILLLHGDTLCTGDIEYQSLRKILRDADWQRAFLAQDVSSRLAAARSLRQSSRQAGAGKAAAIMDVSDEAVCARFAASAAPVMIHGHTHRPATHDSTVEDVPRTRFVLGDWHADGADVVIADAQGIRRVRCPAGAPPPDVPPPFRG